MFESRLIFCNFPVIISPSPCEPETGSGVRCGDPGDDIALAAAALLVFPVARLINRPVFERSHAPPTDYVTPRCETAINSRGRCKHRQQPLTTRSVHEYPILIFLQSRLVIFVTSCTLIRIFLLCIFSYVVYYYLKKNSILRLR